MFPYQFILLAVTAAPIPGAAQSLELLEAALVDHARIVLADVARVPARLALVELGRAPRIGYVERIDRLRIEQAIRRVSNHGTLTWSGATSVAVRTKTQCIAAKALVDVAMAAAAAQFGGAGRDLTISLAAPVADVDVPAGRVTVVPGPVPARMQSGRATVWVGLVVDGEPYRSVPVRFAIAARQQVYVARMPLPVGAFAQARDFDLAEAEVDDANVVPTESLLPTFRIGRAIRAGQPLVRAAMLQSGQIMRGDQVRVRVEAGPIGIETSAVAMTDARPGEALKVRPAGARAVVAGRVSHSGYVVID